MKQIVINDITFTWTGQELLITTLTCQHALEDVTLLQDFLQSIAGEIQEAEESQGE